MSSKKTPSNTTLFIIFIILAALPRLWRLNTDLLIHFDQGLHALGSWQIWHELQPKLLGHQTDVDGIFHGPFYYLLMSIPYALSGGEPFYASLFQIILELISLPFLFLAIERLFNRKTATLTLFIYSLSYGMIGYSRWLSNVTPIIPLSNLLLFIITLPKTKNIHIFFISLIIGLISQLNGAVGFTLIFVIFWLLRHQLNIKKIITIFFGIIIPATPQLLFEIRHQFVITKGIIRFFTSSESGGFSIPINQFLTNIYSFLTQISYLFSYKLFIFSTIIFIISLVFLFRSPSKKILIPFIIIPIILLSFFKRGAIGFFFIYTFPLSLAIIANFIIQTPKLLKIILISSFFFINIFYFQNLLHPSNALTPIGTPNLITLQDRKNIVDWIYHQSNQKDFSVWIYTIPYNLDDPWNYFFVWYGQKKYHYQPEKTASFSPNDLKKSEYFFAIYEPDENRPFRLSTWLDEVSTNFGPPLAIYQSHDAIVTFHQIKPQL